MVLNAEKDLQEALRRSEEGRTRLRAALTQTRGEAEAELREVRKQLRAAEEMLASAEKFDQCASAERIEALRDHLEELARCNLNLGESELNETRSALAEATRTLVAEQEANRRLRAQLAARLASAAAAPKLNPGAPTTPSSKTLPGGSTSGGFFSPGGDSTRTQMVQQMQQSLQSAMVELSALGEHNAQLKAELELARVSVNNDRTARTQVTQADAAAHDGRTDRDHRTQPDGAAVPIAADEAAAPSPHNSSEVLGMVSAQLEALAAQRAQLLRGWADAAWQLRRAGRVAMAQRSAAGDASPPSELHNAGQLGAHARDEAATARQEAAENALRKAARQHASDMWRERQATVLAVQRANVAEKALQAMRAPAKPATPRAAQGVSAPQLPQTPTGASRSLPLADGRISSPSTRSAATAVVQAPLSPSASAAQTALGSSSATVQAASLLDGAALAEARAREAALRAELSTMERIVDTAGGHREAASVARQGGLCSSSAAEIASAGFGQGEQQAGEAHAREMKRVRARQSATETVLRLELLSAERAAEAHLRAARLALAEAEASRAAQVSREAQARAGAEARTVAERAEATRVAAADASARVARVRAARLRLRLAFEMQMGRWQAGILQAGARAAIARGAAFALAWRSMSGHGDTGKQSSGAEGEDSSRSDCGRVNGAGEDGRMHVAVGHAVNHNADGSHHGAEGEPVTRADLEELVAGIEEATWRAEEEARRAGEAEEAARRAEARAAEMEGALAEAEGALAALRMGGGSTGAASEPGAARNQSQTHGEGQWADAARGSGEMAERELAEEALADARAVSAKLEHELADVRAKLSEREEQGAAALRAAAESARAAAVLQAERLEEASAECERERERCAQLEAHLATSAADGALGAQLLDLRKQLDEERALSDGRRTELRARLTGELTAMAERSTALEAELASARRSEHEAQSKLSALLVRLDEANDVCRAAREELAAQRQMTACTQAAGDSASALSAGQLRSVEEAQGGRSEVQEPGLRAVQEELERVRRAAAAEAAAAATAGEREATARGQAESALRAEQERSSCAAAELEQTSTRLRQAEREVESASQLAKRHEQQAEVKQREAEARVAELQRRETAQADLVRKLQQQLATWEASAAPAKVKSALLPANTAAALNGNAGSEALRLELETLRSELSHARKRADEAASAQAGVQAEGRSRLWQAQAQADSLVHEARQALLQHQRAAQEERRTFTAQLAAVQSRLDEERTRSQSREASLSHKHEQLLAALERERAAARAAKQEGEVTAGRLQSALTSAEHRLRQLDRLPHMVDAGQLANRSCGASRTEAGLVPSRQAERSVQGAQLQIPALDPAFRSPRSNAGAPATSQSATPAAPAPLIDFGAAGPTVGQAQPRGSSRVPLGRTGAPKTVASNRANVLIDLGSESGEPTDPNVDPETNGTGGPATLAFRTRKVVSSSRPVQPAGAGSVNGAATVGRGGTPTRPSSRGLAPAPDRRASGWGSLRKGTYASPGAGGSASGSDEEDGQDEGAPLSFPVRAPVQPRERLFSMDRVRRLLNRAGVDFSPRFQEVLGERAGAAAAFRTPAANNRQQRQLGASQGRGSGAIGQNTARFAYTL